jgi:Tfp pilus assembly major pilin PilA
VRKRINYYWAACFNEKTGKWEVLGNIKNYVYSNIIIPRRLVKKHRFWYIFGTENFPSMVVSDPALVNPKTVKIVESWLGGNIALPYVEEVEYTYEIINQLANFTGISSSASGRLKAIMELERRDLGFKICRKTVEVYIDSTKEVLIKEKRKNKEESIEMAMALLWRLAEKSATVKSLLGTIIE